MSIPYTSMVSGTIRYARGSTNCTYTQESKVLVKYYNNEKEFSSNCTYGLFCWLHRGKE